MKRYLKNEAHLQNCDKIMMAPAKNISHEYTVQYIIMMIRKRVYCRFISKHA